MIIYRVSYIHNRGQESSRLCSRVPGEGGNPNVKKNISSGHCCYEHGSFTQHYAGWALPDLQIRITPQGTRASTQSHPPRALPARRALRGRQEPRGADGELLSGALTATSQTARSPHGAPQCKLRFVKHKP